MVKLIGNKTGISGIYEPEDNVSLVENLNDLRRYVYNSLSNTNIPGLSAGVTDLYLSPDESKIYFSNATSDLIYQYNISGFDITPDYYDLKSFFIAQEGNPYGLFFNDDGTKVYIIGLTNDTIYQYSLGTAWDISTASYDTKSFSVTAQETLPTGLFFKSDGTKVYIVGSTNDTIYQYSLGTPWDISTASYDTKSFSISAQELTPTELFFKDDGTKVYIVGTNNDTIYQYSLSVAWDISTASYDTKSFSVTTQESFPNGLFFKSDGTKVYIVGQNNDTIYQYSLGTPWDISTASYDSKSFSVTTQDTLPTGLFFKSDGTKVYIVGQNNDTIYQYSLGTAWDISTASYDTKSFSIIAQETVPQGLFFKDDGTKVYIVGQTNDTIYQYSLGTAWQISSILSDTLVVTAQDGTPTGITFSNDLSKLYMVGSTNRALHQYDLLN